MKRIIPFILSAALFIPLTGNAATFDEACAPETEHNPGLLSPNLAFMLDRSGSMGSDSSEMGKTRWTAAKEAINETVTTFTTPGACTSSTDPNCDKVRFGLGLFNDQASFPVKVDEDSDTDIQNTLANNAPDSLTAMGLAAQLLENEPTLNDSTRSNHAVFITDGYPFVGCGFEGNRDTLVDAVIALCNASTRSNPLITSVIGFGGDTNKDTISLLAAAGGTGSCCDTADCSTTPIDVCSMGREALNNLIEDNPYYDDYHGKTCHNSFPDPDKITCTGGIDITSNSQLKDSISGIVSAAACTFPLDIPAGYPDGAALSDPDFTRVAIGHKVYGNVLVDNIGDCDAPMGSPSSLPTPDYENEGWCFVNNRRSIQVTEKLCGDISASDIDKVVTQLACYCKLTGESCSITNIMCNGRPCTNQELMNMPCSAGEYICDKGQDVCVGTGNGALPEICNGVDDNCDGMVDNMGDSEVDWDKPAFASYKDSTGLHCEFENVCACDDGAKAPVTFSGGVEKLLEDSIAACSCQAALEFEESSTNLDDNEERPDDAATCSALAKDPSGLLYLLIPIGLVGFLRRRKA